MKLSILFLTVLSLSSLCVYAQTPCFARITATARADGSGRWASGSTTYQIYDVTAVNAGTCTLRRIVGFFSAGAGFITETWNYDKSTGEITGYGGELAVGASFNGAGFVAANTTAVTLALDRPGCDDTCSATTTVVPSEPTSPSTPSASTPSASTPSSSTPVPASSCPITLTQTRSAETGSAGETLNTYSITITNTGTKSVTTPVFFITLVEGQNLGIVSTEGLVVYATTVPAQILVSLPPNTVIPAGSSYTSASYVTNNTVTDLRLDSCIAVGADSTSPTTTSAPTTSSPSSSPTTTTAPSTGSCVITPTITRDGYSWTDAQGRSTSVYRLTITNGGPCALKDYALSFGVFPGEILSTWNLNGTRGGYLVTGYGDVLAAGASYNGAGLIIAGAPDTVSAAPYGSNCVC